MTTIRSATFVALVATASVVMAGVIVTSTASPYQAPSSASSGLVVVHQLPRVVVTGEVQRSQVAQIVELPRVVVTGRRVDDASTLVSQDDRAKAASRT